MQRKQTRKRVSNIAAYCIISESEIVKVLPEYNASMEYKQPEKFKQMLYDLGIDTKRAYERQDGLWHKNRFNEVVLCSRYVGHERIDDEWVASGYASQAAIDKASGSILLEDLYRSKNLTEDQQQALMHRDTYKTIEEAEG